MTTRLRGACRQLRQALAGDAADLRGDAELLDQFLTSADEGAFAALVRRYGPMVLGVCGRLVGQAQDAEDAFQATFLVLARKARSIVRRERIGPWLYGVACRTARKARARAARHRAAEGKVAAMNAEPRVAESAVPDWQPLFDRELQALPEKFRVPIVLCELQGLTRREAARQLRLSEGTLSSRLARGRLMLRQRLQRQGFSGTTGLAVAVPAALAGSTARAALVFTGKAAGSVSAPVLTLTEGVLQSMVISKCKIGLVVLTLVGLLTGVGSRPTNAVEAAPPVKPTAAGPDARNGKIPAAENLTPDERAFQGTWKIVRREEKGRLNKEPSGYIRFQGNQVREVSPEGELSNAESFRLDSEAYPKRIDLNLPLGPGGKKPWLELYGIFKFDRDMLWLCFGALGKPLARPPEFRTEKGTEGMLWLLERAPEMDQAPKDVQGREPAAGSGKAAAVGAVDLPDADPPVAVLGGTGETVTRRELGEFLIERYGAEKLELLVNRRIIESACAKKGVKVTAEEVEAAVDAELKELKVDRANFVGNVLKQYGKSLFEWKEDVIKPHLLLAKLGRPGVRVSDKELQREFEHRHGAKVRCKVIIWPKGREAAIVGEYEAARTNPKAAEDLFHGTAWGTLTEVGKREFLVSRYADDPHGQRIADEAFKLKPGELSPPFPVGEETYAVLCLGRVPAEADRDFGQEKPVLYKHVLERKVAEQSQSLFRSLRDEAKPKLLLGK